MLEYLLIRYKVCGHPKYDKYQLSLENIVFDTSDILVITKSAPGSPPQNDPILYDRGNLILYLNTIQKVLNNIGIKK